MFLKPILLFITLQNRKALYGYSFNDIHSPQPIEREKTQTHNHTSLVWHIIGRPIRVIFFTNQK